MSLEGGSANRSEKNNTGRARQEAEMQAGIDGYNARLPEALKYESLKELTAIESAFGDRMRELSREKTAGSATSEQQQEWQERSNIWSEVRDMLEQASLSSGLMSAPPALTKVTAASRMEPVPYAARHLMSFDRVRSIQGEDKIAKVAQIYEDVRKKLESMPV